MHNQLIQQKGPKKQLNSKEGGPTQAKDPTLDLKGKFKNSPARDLEKLMR
jgi:hypothetical protein